jgi:predicted RNase H-like nuclease (RuvC/YqgF family)
MNHKNNTQIMQTLQQNKETIKALEFDNQTLTQKVSAANKENQEMKQRMSTMQQQHKEQMSSMQQQIDQLKQLVLVNQSTVKTTTQPNKPSEY